MNQDTPGSGDLMRRVFGNGMVVLRDEEIFLRTRLGREEAARADSTMPRRLRTLLLLVDGRRSMADFRRGLTRFRNLEESIDMLMKMGLIEPLPQILDI